MPIGRIFDTSGINLFVNPILKKDSDLLVSVNVDSYPYGAKRKRAGYDTFLGTANGSSVTNLFSWTNNAGSLTLYRESGGILYHSLSGTGAWTISGNGTVTAGNRIGYAVLDNTLIVCDGAGSTRHTTNGTSFTNTTLAPVAVDLVQYQNRIHALGTSSTNFYSTTGSADNWALSGTGDSSSFTVPGEGRLARGFVSNDRLILSKTNGNTLRWDGYNLVDLGSKKAMSSPSSLAEEEGYYFWLNRSGIYGYGGARPELLSNAVQPQIYNDSGSAITGSAFNTAKGVVHNYNYYLAVGTTTDDIVEETISNAIIKYDFQKNEFSNYSYANNPTAWHSYTDSSGVRQLILGTSNGQCYKINGSTLSDNGTAIQAKLLYMIHMGVPDIEKRWRVLTSVFNPGCSAKIAIATADTFTVRDLDWIELGDARAGIVEYRFPTGSRSRLLFVKITDSGISSRFKFYGFAVDVEPEGTNR